MQRVADIIVEQLAEAGINTVFMITGGGAMHLNDAFGRYKKIRTIFNHHEQACAMAAESFTRLSGRTAAVNVTSGPGGINALNGVYGAYVDSIAMVVISGQIKRETLAGNCSLPLRQLGDQEVDIISMVRPITKYATILQEPEKVVEVMRKAIYIAGSGRPGPVWIDVPLDVQSALLDSAQLPGWQPGPAAVAALAGDPELAANTRCDFNTASSASLDKHIEEIITRLGQARRPVIMGGAGVRLAGYDQMFLEMGAALNIPLVAGWNAYDLVPNSHPCYAGRPGTIGDRPGNFTVQNADFLLVLGSRLNIRQISYNWAAFAGRAWKAQVDIDSAELYKPTLNNNLNIHADLRDFLPKLAAAMTNWQPLENHKQYLEWCRQRVARYPVLQPAHKLSSKINPYYFMDRLFSRLESGDAVVTANATAAVVSAQAGEIKPGVRLYSNSGDASMGYDLPAAIGAAVSGAAKRVICLAGDGSIMMNMQELQTIATYKLPIIIFLLNNNGYLSIRQTQSAYFPDNRLGTEPATGVDFPNFVRLAESMSIPAGIIASHSELGQMLPGILNAAGPVLYEIILDPEQAFEPKLVSQKLPDGTMLSPSLDNMAPFLSPDELASNIIKD